MTVFFFVSVIAILFVLAAGAAIGHSYRYSSTETAALAYVANKIVRIAETQDDATDGSLERRLIPVSELAEGLPADTLIADRLALIRRMRESQVKVNLAALQQMTLAKESSVRWLSFPSFAASLSMMLGLLGTVVGLSVMVQHLGAALPTDPFDLAQVERWRNEFQAVLAAMRTGFLSTLAGLVSAILLGWLNHRLAHAQSAFLDKLDRFTTGDLLPATVPSTDDENLLEKVSMQMEANFKRLDEVSRHNESTLKELNAIQRGFIEIVDAIRQTTRSETSDRISALVGKLSSVLENMTLINQSVVNVTETLPGVVERAESINAASITRVDRLIEAYEHQRGLVEWPMQVKVVFAFLAILNLLLAGRLIFQ